MPNNDEAIEAQYSRTHRRVAEIFYPHIQFSHDEFRWDYTCVLANAWLAAHLVAAEPTARDRARLKRQILVAAKQNRHTKRKSLIGQKSNLRSTIRTNHRPPNHVYESLVIGLHDLYVKIYSKEPPRTAHYKRSRGPAVTWNLMLQTAENHLVGLLPHHIKLQGKRNISRFAKSHIGLR
jgi:hypothetical protein